MADTIRLAVSGAEAVWPLLAAGLRQAQVETVVADGQPPLDACDAVLFLEPRTEEAALVARCLGAGKHVLLTPRPWLSIEVLDGFASAAQAAGAQLAVGNADRFLPSRQLIRQQVDAGSLGEPGLIRLHRWRETGPERGSDGEGGALPIPLPMALDLDVAMWLMGAAPTLVYALERIEGHNGAPTGRLTQLHLGFPVGAWP
jgi:predicted dehydrogenase